MFFRRYVEKELSPRLDVLPEKHNLSFFPTINEIYNQIHQVLQDLNSIELNAKDTGLRQVVYYNKFILRFTVQSKMYNFDTSIVFNNSIYIMYVKLMCIIVCSIYAIV